MVRLFCHTSKNVGVQSVTHTNLLIGSKRKKGEDPSGKVKSGQRSQDSRRIESVPGSLSARVEFVRDGWPPEGPTDKFSLELKA